MLVQLRIGPPKFRVRVCVFPARARAAITSTELNDEPFSTVCGGLEPGDTCEALVILGRFWQRFFSDGISIKFLQLPCHQPEALSSNPAAREALTKPDEITVILLLLVYLDDSPYSLGS